MTFTVTYYPSLTNQRDMEVNLLEKTITVEDRPPADGGKPISDAEYAMIDYVMSHRRWKVFCISQAVRRYAWTKEAEFNGPGSWPCDRHLRLPEEASL